MTEFYDRFLRVQTGAARLAEPIDAAISVLLEGGKDNVFFLGTGGAAILMQPAAHLLGARSSFPTYAPLSAELVLGGSRHLGERSIVVIPSLSGTTKESIAAMDYCKARGATIITMVGNADTPLGKGGDHVFVNAADDETSTESFYLQSLFLALSIMRHRDGFAGFASFLEDTARLPEALLAVKRAFDDRAAAFAEEIRDTPWHVITGAGDMWPEAFYYGMCILEEMQWIRTRPVHASDFFHGTLELVEPGVSVILLKGEDEYRPLADRVETFARDITDRLTVFDTATQDLPGISRGTRALISPIVAATMLERVSAHLAEKRNHPLTTRRYYRRVAY
jgi:fructoselysine-6-phosphate deglycase